MKRIILFVHSVYTNSTKIILLASFLLLALASFGIIVLPTLNLYYVIGTVIALFAAEFIEVSHNFREITTLYKIKFKYNHPEIFRPNAPKETSIDNSTKTA